MRKKFIAVYALMAVLALGSTTLTSCVDDNESASVTAIRDAKAEQLKALAALSNAQAEAAKIQAEAEAALKNAQAEWKKEQTEEAKQKFAIKIEVIKAQAERDIALAKKQALKYEKEIWNNANAKIQAMVSDYQTALNKVISTKEELIEAKIDYAHIEVDSTLAEAKYKEFVIGQNQIIAQNEADIKRLQALAEGGADKTALAEQMEVLAGQAYKMLHTDLPAVEAKEAEAEKAKEDAYLPINIDKPFTEDQEHEKLEWEAGLLPYAKGVQTLKAYEAEYSDEDEQIKFIEADNETYVASIKECFEEEVVTVYTRSKGSDFVKATQVVENALNQDIATATANLGAKKTATEAGTGALGRLEQAEADLKAKQAALAAENAKPDKDQNVIEQLEEDIDGLNVTIEREKEYVTQYTEEIAELNQELKDFQATLEVVKEGSDAQKQYIETAKTVLKAAEAYVTAQHEVHKVQSAIDLIGLEEDDFNNKMEVTGYANLGSEYDQLNQLYTETADVEALIAECEKNIAEAKKAIERGEMTSNTGKYEETYIEYLADEDGDGIKEWHNKLVELWVPDTLDERFTETTRAMMEENIKRLEEQLAVYEQIANNYKAALDAAIQASDSDVNVPETPEEGGEETPAE